MTKGFSAWKLGAVHYVPALILALVCLYAVYRGNRVAWVGVVLFLTYGLFSLFFFRDPSRTISAQSNEVVSPADGTVVAIEDLKETPYYAGACRRLSIFLSVFNVHVNRAPFDGVVRDVEHKSGEFRMATRPETTDVNEATTIRLDTERGPMTVRQIAGVIARRIVCRTSVGERLVKGEKFGMIKFGSRTELYLPVDTPVCVKEKDTVRGGLTVVGRFP